MWTGGLTPGERRNFTFASGTLLEHAASTDKLVIYFTDFTQPFHRAALRVKYCTGVGYHRFW